MSFRALQPSVALALLIAAPPSLVVSGILPTTAMPQQPSGVIALAFLDLDGDAMHDAGAEPILTDWDLCLTSPITTCDGDPTGGVSRWWLEARSATISAAAPPGFRLTTPHAQTVNVEAGRVATVRFGATHVDVVAERDVRR